MTAGWRWYFHIKKKHLSYGLFCLFLIISSTLLFIPVSTEPLADFRPRTMVLYEGDGLKILVEALEPSGYSTEPKIKVNIIISGKMYSAEYNLLSGELIRGNAPWQIFPFFTKRYLSEGDIVFYDDGAWKVVGYGKIFFRKYDIKTVILVKNGFKRIYDWVAGLLLEGDICINGTYHYIKIKDTNLEWIYLKYKGIYIDWFNITVILKNYNESGVFKVYSIGRSVLGRNIWAAEYGPPNATQVILVTANIHGPELIGSRVILHVLKKLVNNTVIFKGLRDKGEKLVFIFPLNPDGLEACKLAPPEMAQRPYVRKNARFVDLNRNFNARWGESGASTNILSNNYMGPNPASEPETRGLQDFINRNNVTIHIDLHSGDIAVIIPPKLGVEKDKSVEELGLKVARIMGFSVSQGTSTGLAYFYTYYVKPKALSMIVELWLKDTPTWFERYNPTSEKKVSELGERFYKVIYFLVTGKDSSGQNYLLDNLYLIIFLLEAVAIGIIFLLYYRKRRQKALYFSGGCQRKRSRRMSSD
ncbi:MAG: hypothetical protein DRJ47_03070 [Thermoprotei archaeon]|nr:MAG: hypothetical protein DRJ47_03070 [Thermoprotei archaeon]